MFTVFYPLPVYQEKRLQRLQNAYAGFVTRKFAGLEDIIKLNWLPVHIISYIIYLYLPSDFRVAWCS